MILLLDLWEDRASVCGHWHWLHSLCAYLYPVYKTLLSTEICFVPFCFPPSLLHKTILLQWLVVWLSARPAALSLLGLLVTNMMGCVRASSCSKRDIHFCFVGQHQAKQASQQCVRAAFCSSPGLLKKTVHCFQLAQKIHPDLAFCGMLLCLCVKTNTWLSPCLVYVCGRHCYMHPVSLQPPLSSCSHSLNARWTLLCIMTWQSFASAAETSASLIHVLLMIYHLPLSHTCTGLCLSTWLTSSRIHLNWGSCRLVEGKYKVMFNEVRPHKTKSHIKEIQSQGVLIHSFSTQQHHFLFSFIPLLPPHCQPEFESGRVTPWPFPTRTLLTAPAL